MGERDGDARVLIVISLFFACVVVGGVFLSLYTFRPKTESPSWLYPAGIVLEAIPLCFWLLGYLRLCLLCSYHWFRPSPEGFTAGVNSIVEAPEPALPENPQLPVNDSPHGGDNDDDEQRHVHFGPVIVMGNEEQNGHQSSVEGHNNNALGNEEGGGDHSHSNIGSTSNVLNDQDLSIALRESEMRESEMPLTGVSSCK
ncbi:uncharacterized protein LOC120291675 [Eucalyptus grandis]|uniref:uncharacterized protein LOC120291675 n=1 Tax=Eucalyptus grandis TaxID=71139 RepID=UPI00192F01E3|nr:uncharacterized protein LOC120291675 [Eucalyptus grandis]